MSIDVTAPASGAFSESDTRTIEISPSGYLEQILDRELKLTLHGIELGSERDDSMRQLTDTAATLYDGRILRELIQNAYDGAGEDVDAHILVKLDLASAPHAMLDVCNTGNGFSRADVDSIVNPARSRKQPGNSIGHKGLGFRSVTLISHDPQIYSSQADNKAAQFDGFCFRFADEQAQRERLLHLAEPDLAERAVGKTHSLQLPLVINSFPDDIKDYASHGFATVIRLPLTDRMAASRMEKEWQSLFDERAPLNLFLPKLTKLVFEKIDPDGTTSRRELTRRRYPLNRPLKIDSLEIEEIVVDNRSYLFISRAVDQMRFLRAVDAAVEQRHKVERWRNWTGAPTVSIAIPLGFEVPEGRYYAFLPMETPCPFNGHLDAPFFPDPDRKGLSLDNALNQELVKVAAEMCIDLIYGVAAANINLVSYVHAAVDAITWAPADHVLTAFQAKGLAHETLPLPTMSPPGSDARWATLDHVFDWQDDQYKSLRATWIAKVTGEFLLRRKLGARRVAALRSLADDVGLPLEPENERLAKWVPLLAADLERQRKATAANWEDFYTDLSVRKDILEQLRGKPIFRNEARKLVRAEGAKSVAGEPVQFFINADPGRVTKKKKRLDDAGVFPPSCITKGLEFADPTLAWSADVVTAFVNAGLASEFRLINLVSRLGTLLGTRPRARDALSVLTWAFRTWKQNRTPDFDEALQTAGLWVPLASGGIGKASLAYFSAGWRDTLGNLLTDLCKEASHDKQIAGIAKTMLPDWNEWNTGPGQSAQDWRDFLKIAGVRDGLPWSKGAAVRMDSPAWQSLRYGFLPTQNFELELGICWRKAVAQSRDLGYQSGDYVTNGVPYLYGQASYDTMNGAARLAYGRLIIHALTKIPAEAMVTTLSRRGVRSDYIHWPSAIAAFLKSTAWIPASAGDDFEGLTLGQCWLGSRSDIPRFVPRPERMVRELIENNRYLQEMLSGKLNVPAWSDPKSAPRRIAALGELLERGISEAFLDDFRKAYREAWTEYAQLDLRPALPSTLVIPKDTIDGLTAVTLHKSAPLVETIYIDDGSRPTFQQILASFGRITIDVGGTATASCIRALATYLGCKAQPIHEDSISVTTDGVPFFPSATDELLVSKDCEWIADLAVLVLEVSSNLSNQNTLRARQALGGAIRRVRLRFVREITVSIDGSSSTLPDELDGILPVANEEYPTVLCEGQFLNWSTLSMIASAVPAAIGRPGLTDAFRLTFSAFGNEMSRDGHELKAPSDLQLARALGRPVSRITELRRSLRATTPRLLEYLIPSVHAMGHTDLAAILIERTDEFRDDSDVMAVISGYGIPSDQAERIVSACRDADTLSGLRHELGLEFNVLNASLVALGRSPLEFKKRLTERFSSRVEHRRAEVERAVRDAYTQSIEADGALQAYREAVALKWLHLPDDWVERFDDIDTQQVDEEIDRQVTLRLGAGPFPNGSPIDGVRQHNRQLLTRIAEHLQRLVRAWAKCNSTPLDELWLQGPERLIRAALSSGTLDFESLNERSVPSALHRASLWPNQMPESLDTVALGLSDSDLAFEALEERERETRRQKERRSLQFGELEIDGGTQGWYDAVAQAMQETLASGGFKTRSGPAALQVFGPRTAPRPTKRGTSNRGDDPQYLSQEQRDLIGFAGELAAYQYLRNKHRNMRPEYWVSSMGRRYLGLPPESDQGFDFKVSDAKGFIHYEVKAHVADPGHIDLERSQVTAAVTMRHDGTNRWRILYVANVRGPNVAVYELPNPYSLGASRLFRESHQQGVRFTVMRE
ncbi:ATP-binding protein [Pseudomonas sp. LB3P93]